jgi:hypothetical protein
MVHNLVPLIQKKVGLAQLIRAPLEHRNFTGMVQEFHREQFKNAGKTQDWEKIPPIQRRP